MLTEIESLQTDYTRPIEYTFDLAVRNVERLNVSRFVTGVHMFQPRSGVLLGPDSREK